MNSYPYQSTGRCTILQILSGINSIAHLIQLAVAPVYLGQGSERVDSINCLSRLI